MIAEAVAALLGGPMVLDREVRTEAELVAVVERGLPSASLAPVAAALHPALTLAAIYRIVGSARTLQRRRQTGAKLTVGESQRLARLARVVAKAHEALGARDRAVHWLTARNRALGGRRPVDLIGTESGAAVVTDVLGRIEHGVVG